MAKDKKQSGFSLTEMLIATGIMAIGLVMIATVFPVGVKLTSLTTERTIGAVAADEAFAKIKLYGLRDFGYWPSSLINAPAYADPTNTTYETCNDFQFTNLYDLGPNGVPGDLDDLVFEDTDDFLYPSTDITAGQDRSYHWSALCRRVGLKDVQVTVFVNRKIAAGAQYFGWGYTIGSGYSANSNSPWPKPIPVNVVYDPAYPNQLSIMDGPDVLIANDSRDFFDDGYTIVDNYSSRIYRVLEVDRTTNTLTLQTNWFVDPLKPAGIQDVVWVVPPAVGSDRYPCVGVYQKVIRFDDIN